MCVYIYIYIYIFFFFLFCVSVQFSRSVVSDSLWPHEPQHARPPCPSQTPGIQSDPCPSSQWCHPAISSSVVPFSCPQSLPELVFFPVSQLFSRGGQNIGVAASTSVLPMNTQDSSPLNGLVGSSCSPRNSQESSPTPSFESINCLGLSFVCGPTLISIHDYWKNHSFDCMSLCRQNDVSVFNVLSRFVIAFLPRSKHLLRLWMQSPFTVILEPKKIVKNWDTYLASPLSCTKQ